MNSNELTRKLHEEYERGKASGYQQGTAMSEEQREADLWWGSLCGACLMIVLASYMNYKSMESAATARRLQQNIATAVATKEVAIRKVRGRATGMRSSVEELHNAVALQRDQLHQLYVDSIVDRRKRFRARLNLAAQEVRRRSAHERLRQSNWTYQRTHTTLQTLRFAKSGLGAACVGLSAMMSSLLLSVER